MSMTSATLTYDVERGLVALLVGACVEGGVVAGEGLPGAVQVVRHQVDHVKVPTTYGIMLLV